MLSKIAVNKCLIVLPDDDKIIVPEGISSDRSAYVAVRISEDLQTVELLGFYPSFDPNDPPEEIEFNELHPMENLVDRLVEIKAIIDFYQSNNPLVVTLKELLIDDSEFMVKVAPQTHRIFTQRPLKRQLSDLKYYLKNTPEMVDRFLLIVDSLPSPPAPSSQRERGFRPFLRYVKVRSNRLISKQ